MNLNLDIIKKETLTIYKVSGKILSQSEIDYFNSEFDENIEQESCPKIIFDLKDLTHINSSGLNQFIKCFTKSRNKGGELVIIHLEKQVLKLLEITKLISVFTIAENQEEAEQILNDL